MTRINDSFLGHTVRTANTAGRLASHRRGPHRLCARAGGSQRGLGSTAARRLARIAPLRPDRPPPPPLPLARAAPRSESGPPPPPQPERPLDRGRAERGWGGHRGDPEAPPLPTRIADSDIRRAAAGVAFGGGPGAVLRDVGRDAARPGPLLLFIYFLYLLSLLLYNDDVMIKNNNDK